MTRRSIFLSASIPTVGRAPFDDEIRKYEIRESVVALVGSCYEADLDLVFGGHPAITPLVHHAARAVERLQNQDRDDWTITIFQSEHFFKYFVPEVFEFQKLSGRNFQTITPYKMDVQTDFDRRRVSQLSVAKMRDAMINLDRYDFTAGVFIGGMEGIIDEFDRFGSQFDGVPQFPISSTGGATKLGWQKVDNPKFLAVCPENHPRPKYPPLLERVREQNKLNSQALKALQLDADLARSHSKTENQERRPTYRTLFRRLFEPLL